MQAPMQHGCRRASDPLQRNDRPEAEASERRQLQAARGISEMRERVGAGIAVISGVRQRPDAAGVENDHECPAQSSPSQ